MRIPSDSFRDVSKSVIPIMLIVFILSAFFIDVSGLALGRFILGSLTVILGLGIFLWGIDLSVSNFGQQMGEFVVTRNNIFKIIFAGFFFGFVITVAEPNVAILAEEISLVAGGIVSSLTVIIGVSLGVGLLVGLGIARIVKGFPMHLFFIAFYGSYLVLLLFVPESFHAFAYDASGASTGAITTPFFLALALGAAKLKGSDAGEADSFGMVGIASMGPILALMLMSFFIDINPDALEPAGRVVERRLFDPFISQFLQTLKDAALCLVPISLVFFILNKKVFKIKNREFRRIILGLIYTFIGLVLFLLGVSSGFMDMGTILGMELARHGLAKFLLPLVGFILGAVIVLAEPSVSVLGNQIQDVTGGSIQKSLIERALMVGVGFSVALSMVRVLVPAFRFWMIAGPVFLSIIILSFLVKPIFVGISFDSGGVASGPMSATFLVAMMQGAAQVVPTANPVLDGFGALATIAMVPILCVFVVGYIYTRELEKGEVNHD